MRSLLASGLLLTAASGERLTVTYVERKTLQQSVATAPKTNPQRLEQVRQLFASTGCETTNQRVKASKLPNLVCELPGPAASPSALHFDDYWEAYRLIATYLAYLDEKLPLAPAP